MHISIIDPSLFTVPYDCKLSGALSAAGHIVRLHGRPMNAEDNDTGGIQIIPDFYRVATMGAVAALPKPIRLGIKGIDHFASMTRLASQFKAQRPDIIHFQWLPLPIVDRRFLKRLRDIAPLILTVHDTTPYNGDPGAVRARGFAECLHAFDHLITHTQQGRHRLLAKGIPDAAISVLPHGLIDSLPPAPPIQQTGRLTLLMFGKIKPYKGVDVLIEAFAMLPAELREQATLRVIGKAYLPLEPLRALAQARGVADSLLFEERFVPDIEVNALFSPGVVAVFPYRDIEASGVLTFALANCCPIVASAIGDFAERIEDGVQGLLVPPDDKPALAAALARMIGNRDFATECGRNARLLAEATPDWTEIGSQTLEVYDRARLQAVRRFGATAPRSTVAVQSPT